MVLLPWAVIILKKLRPNLSKTTIKSRFGYEKAKNPQIAPVESTDHGADSRKSQEKNNREKEPESCRSRETKASSQADTQYHPTRASSHRRHAATTKRLLLVSDLRELGEREHPWIWRAKASMDQERKILSERGEHSWVRFSVLSDQAKHEIERLKKELISSGLAFGSQRVEELSAREWLTLILFILFI